MSDLKPLKMLQMSIFCSPNSSITCFCEDLEFPNRTVEQVLLIKHLIGSTWSHQTLNYYWKQNKLLDSRGKKMICLPKHMHVFCGVAPFQKEQRGFLMM